jgi:predicted nucleotidyltransferase
MKTIAKYENGSKSYGLSNKDSDKDEAFLFLNTKVSDIIGLNRHDHQNKLDESIDSTGYELRHFLNLLRKGNSSCLEFLHNEIWIERTKEFDYIKKHKKELIDSKKIFRVLLGYMSGEKHIITGTNHKGKLGEKRKSQLEQFGYSYRNCVHALRLARTGIIFFRDGYYPVNIVECDKDYGAMIKDVKNNPQNYKAENLINLIEKLEGEMKKCFDLRSINYKFNEDIANEICCELYLPFLKETRIL